MTIVNQEVATYSISKAAADLLEGDLYLRDGNIIVVPDWSFTEQILLQDIPVDSRLWAEATTLFLIDPLGTIKQYTIVSSGTGDALQLVQKDQIDLVLWLGDHITRFTGGTERFLLETHRGLVHRYSWTPKKEVWCRT